MAKFPNFLDGVLILAQALPVGAWASDFPSSTSARIVFYDVARSKGLRLNALVEVADGGQFWYEACHVTTEDQGPSLCIPLSKIRQSDNQENRDEFNTKFFQYLHGHLVDGHVSREAFETATNTFVVVTSATLIIGSLFGGGFSKNLRRGGKFGFFMALIAGALEFGLTKIEGMAAERTARQAMPAEGQGGVVIDVLPIIFMSAQEALENTGVI
jgi:hypothetical protein